jgi:hypothetical protein
MDRKDFETIEQYDTVQLLLDAVQDWESPSMKRSWTLTGPRQVILDLNIIVYAKLASAQYYLLLMP